jgi:uncharacterized protein (TIGR03083 family)
MEATLDDATIDVGGQYRRTRQRLSALLAGVPDDEWRTPVAACPGWDVHAVVSHLLGVVEDALAGVITGPPDEDQTADEVARHRQDAPGDLLARWAELAPPFEDVVTSRAVVPAALDVASHEQDVRSALRRPGARDDEVVRRGARWLVEGLELDGATVVVDLGGDVGVVRTVPSGGPEYRLRASAFEVLRFRLGRRTPDQVAALDWSPRPDPLPAGLFQFGPAAAPLVE